MIYRFRCVSDNGAMHEEWLCSLCADIIQNQAIPIHVTTKDEVLDVFEHLQTLLPHSVACRRCIKNLLSPTESESVIHNGQVIALVHPPPSPEETGRWRFFGSQKGSIQIADDFDAPLEDFKDYMP